MNDSISEKGFSVVELVIVLIMIGILSALAIVSLNSTTKYKPDDQALIIVDMFNEARQSALNQRRTFRLEVNRTKNELTLINENGFGNVDDDEIVKSIPIKSFVTVGEIPSNILAPPTATSPIPILEYVSSNYPLSNGDEKITLRFARNGRVLDTGTDNIGTGSTIRGATIYVFSNKDNTTIPEIIRAVTVLETTGDTSILKCSFDTNAKCGNWKK